MFVFDLVNFLVGAGAGMVVSVLVPKVFTWMSGEVKTVEASAVADAAVAKADLKSAVASAANTVSKL